MFKKIFFPFFLLTLAVLASCSNKDADQAIAVNSGNLDSLLLQYPDSVALLVKRGNLYLDSNDFDEAYRLGAKAYRLDSSNIDARFLYANGMNNRDERNLTDIETAQKHFHYIVDRQPKNVKAYVSLASTYSQLNESNKAFGYINEALKINPRYRDAYILKGTIYLSEGNRKLAKSSYETAIQQDPKFFEGYMALAHIYTDENEPIALQYFKTAAEINPKSTDAKYGVAYFQQDAGLYDEALQSYRELLHIDSSYYLSYFNQAYIKENFQNQLDSAIYLYYKSVTLQPKFVKGWHNLGMCYKAKGMKSDALKSFAKALKYNPDFQLSRDEANKLK